MLFYKELLIDFNIFHIRIYLKAFNNYTYYLIYILCSTEFEKTGKIN